MTSDSRSLNVEKIENLELFLLNLRYKEGRLVEVEGNRPILLNDPTYAWIVYSGFVDLFSVPVAEEDIVGVNRHLFRGGTGQLLLGIDTASHASGIGIRVSGTPGTRLLKIRKERLIALGRDIETQDFVVAMVNDWVTGLSQGIGHDVVPRDYQLLEQNDAFPVELDGIVAPQRDVLWTQAEGGRLQMMGMSQLSWRNGAGHIPISPRMWARADADAVLSVMDTIAFVRGSDDWAEIDRFQRLVLDAIVINRSAENRDEYERLQRKADAEQTVMERSLASLASPLSGSETITTAVAEANNADYMFAACKLVVAQLGVELEPPAPTQKKLMLGQQLQRMIDDADLHMRDVALRTDWWKADNGPLLGFLDKNQRPVALLRKGGRQYEMVDTVAGAREVVSVEIAATLMPLAYTLYRPFPSRAISFRDMLQFGVHGSTHDLRSILLLSTIIAFAGLLPPIVMSQLFDKIIPNGQTNTLLQVGLGLIVIALASSMLQIARGIAFLRVQTRLDVNIQAAVWNRLLNLPMPFFRDYTSGDLGMRAMGISTIRRALSGYVVTTLVTSLFSVFNLALLFVYSPRLALTAVGLVITSLIVTAAFGAYYLRFQRKSATIQGKVAGTVLQLLTGIVKIRVAGAENQAFFRWANRFTEQKQLSYKSSLVTNALATYNAAYPLIATTLIFTTIALSRDMALSTGDFLAFNLAFIQFLVAWRMLGNIMLIVLPLIPVWDRLKPILTTLPEVDDSKRAPSELSGGIEVNHISFRYGQGEPLVLKDVSLKIEPGEFVAFVGTSGSGKSTMMRMLLGFEEPEAGGVYIDDQDLRDLDLRAVRRQIGVVLQNGMLMPQDIYSNIVGSSPDLTLEDAWEASEMAGLDIDIKAMPMGMHTVISERGGNFSGGQRQRLLIARALVNKPRILFFDEATSALDNRTQDIVSRSLDHLKATRIVIAHRLSTIVNADRIFVFDQGKIVQSGTYDELLQMPGPFEELAKRQLA